MTDTSSRTDSAMFVEVGEGAVVPTVFARGPWNPDWLHGGPVAALLANAVEQLASDEIDWFIARLTVEFDKPVPIEPLRCHAEVTRSGRRVSTVEASVSRADTGVALARARAVRIRSTHVPLPLDDAGLRPFLVNEPAPSEPADGHPGSVDEHADVAFHRDGIEHRFVDESELRVGPVFDWIRLRVPLLPERPLTPLQRVAAAVDNASGISGVLPWDSHSFVNPDLSIHLFRPLEGEWAGLASVSHHSSRGIGMTVTAIYDIDGRVGSSNQSLVLDLR